MSADGVTPPSAPELTEHLAALHEGWVMPQSVQTAMVDEIASACSLRTVANISGRELSNRAGEHDVMTYGDEVVRHTA